MTNAEDRPERRPRGDAARTAVDGTPFPVDMSADRRARAAIALFVAGPVIWSVHFMVIYVVTEAACSTDGPGMRLFNPPVPTVTTLVATAIAAVACLATAAVGYRRWHSSRQEAIDEGDDAQGRPLDPKDRAGLLAFAGFLMSLLGFVTVLLVGLPALVLPAC